MGRPPKVRDSYMADVAALASIIRAVEADTGRPKEWRDTTAQILKEGSKALMEAPSNGGLLEG